MFRERSEHHTFSLGASTTNMNWGLSFDEISNVYLDMVRYRHDEYVEPTKWKTDIIINGSTASEQAVAAIVGLVEKSCSN